MILDEYGFTVSFTFPVIITIFSVVFIIVFAYLIVKSFSRQKYIVSILNDQVNPDLFMKELQDDLEKTKNKNFINQLLLNKSSALFHKGEFDDAIKLLESLDISKFNVTFKQAYYNNLILSLLEVNRLEEAIRTFKSHSDILSSNTKNEKLDMAIKTTMATLDFHQGKLSESKRQFNELLLENPHNSARVSILFYLGRINLKEGEVEIGKERLKEAAEIGKNTYIAQRAQELI